MDATLRLPTTASACLVAGMVCGCALLSGCGPILVEGPSGPLDLSSAGNTPGAEGKTEGQWAGWRGADSHGVADDPRLPTKWSTTEGVRWKVPVPGTGNSSPVIWNERVLVTSATGSGERLDLNVYCFDRHSGGVLWQQQDSAARRPTHSKNGYASATVATDGKRVFAFFGPRGMFCYRLEDGEFLWHAPLDQPEQKWGSAASPILVDNQLLVQVCDGERDSFIVALDAATGTRVWRTGRESTGSWSTPVVVRADVNGAVRTEIVVNGTGNQADAAGFVIAYDPHSGDELWRVRGTTDIPCPTCIVGQGLVISSSGRNGPIFAIRPGGTGDVTASRVAWRNARGGPYVPTGVVYRGRLYVVSDRGVASCYDAASGRAIWSHRLGGPFSASLLAGDGRIFAVGEHGDVYVVAAADEFRLLASNRMDEGCRATPAVSRGELFIRTRSHLYCIAAGEQAVAEHQVDTSPTIDEDSIVSPSDLAPGQFNAEFPTGEADVPGSAAAERDTPTLPSEDGAENAGGSSE